MGSNLGLIALKHQKKSIGVITCSVIINNIHIDIDNCIIIIHIHIENLSDMINSAITPPHLP